MTREDAARIMTMWRDHAILTEQRARAGGWPEGLAYRYATFVLVDPHGCHSSINVSAELLDACVEALTDVSAKAGA